jgi:hypothetical protein
VAPLNLLADFGGGSMFAVVGIVAGADAPRGAVDDRRQGRRDQAAPAPRFSRTQATPVGSPPAVTTPLGEVGWG